MDRVSLPLAAALICALTWAVPGTARPVHAASPASGAAPLVAIMRPAHGAVVCAGKLDVLVDISSEVPLASERLDLDGVSAPFTTAPDGPGAIDLGANIPVSAALHTLSASATDTNGMLGGDTASFTAVTCAPGQTQPGKPTATPTTVGGGTGTGGRPPATPGPGAAPTPSNPNPSPGPKSTSPAAAIAFWLVILSLFLLAVLVIAGVIALFRKPAGGPNTPPTPGPPQTPSENASLSA